VPLQEEHVGYMVAARFHDQPLDLPDLVVGRTDGQAAVYVYCAGRDVVDGDLRRGFRSPRPRGCMTTLPSAIAQFTWLGALPVPVPGGVEMRCAVLIGQAGVRSGLRVWLQGSP
jgi:hypothetical protein